ncbi:hypothetical protein [Streptomyces sp. NRRL S-87]|uniref:hypothetical protein n=1 Tax=Streptomyces sp. NRRL S-87 TaxID=1463920 RepID=UPI00068DEB6D|nr:hypothetical protein [Streptomyces sp. NRRL S-87]
MRRTGNAAKRLAFLLSRFDVKPVTDGVTENAAKLLDVTGLDGHECLVDALIVATAALCTPPVRIVTSDSAQVPKLCAAAETLPAAPDIKVIVV